MDAAYLAGRLVERFFAQRVFGPMRLDKLERQLKSSQRDRKRDQRHVATRLRQLIADAERRKVQVQALEDGLEPEIVSARIAELRADIDAAQTDLATLGPDEIEEERTEHLARIPDLTAQLRSAPPNIKRQTFEAFGLRIDYDKAERRIEVSATVTEAVASAFENTKALRREGFLSPVCDIAGPDLSLAATLAYKRRSQ